MDQQHLLIINAGSSSLKLTLATAPDYQVLGAFLAERLGTDNPTLNQKAPQSASESLASGSGHHEALEACLKRLKTQGLLSREPDAVGHRVVHGGEAFTDSALIDDQVTAAIDGCSTLAPLHNPANLAGIRATRSLYPDCPQVAVFDTAFHQSLPATAYHYAVPQALYHDHGVRRYGFHGTSHRWILQQAAGWLERPPERTSIISAHLGNGCSVTAVRNGRSVDTSMGLTPLEGLVMGTRSGDVDPGLFDFLLRRGYGAEAIHDMLNRESGLLGLSGVSHDMRTLTEAAQDGHEQANLAVNVFCFRLARYIGAMMASLERLDALVFTGGIGENSPLVRQRTLAHLSIFGLALDEASNRNPESAAAIHAPGTPPVLVIPTDEEQMIALDTQRLTTTGRTA
ncbi:acetate/propionate family kinase [Vreelandella utahensis]|uniref:acetate/propionate family kinase n=1 Tax=Vreelandella halophila TaxID=86177 RepID=UPI0009856D18|nr:acetate kinase [Halomonas utahensis]